MAHGKSLTGAKNYASGKGHGENPTKGAKAKDRDSSFKGKGPKFLGKKENKALAALGKSPHSTANFASANPLTTGGKKAHAMGFEGRTYGKKK